MVCKYGFVDVLKIFISKKCNLEKEMIWNIKPIHIACLVGNVEILKLLIANKCDLESVANIPTKENIDKIFNINSHNSDVIDQIKTVKTRPIHIACWKGYYNIVKLLIDNNCSLNSDDKDKWKPIHVVCVYGFVDILKLLIEHNCNTESEDKYKTRPIHYACKTGHVNIVKTLIENNCNFESQNVEKRRPIHYACKSGHIDLVKILVHNKCHLESEDINGKTPLDLAIDNGHEVCADIILTGIESRKRKISKIKQVIAENPRLQSSSKDRMKIAVKARVETRPYERGRNLCKICYDREVDCVLSCGHVYCMTCGKKFAICPVCRTRSTAQIRLFLD